MLTKEIDFREINNFDSVVEYLRDQQNWPIESDNLEDITFEYSPNELGISKEHQINIKSIQQLRPLTSNPHNQPWGIFFVDFDTNIALRAATGLLALCGTL